MEKSIPARSRELDFPIRSLLRKQKAISSASRSRSREIEVSPSVMTHCPDWLGG